MKTYFELEFKKALFTWRVLISTIIILGLLLFPYLKESRFGRYPFPGLDGVDYYIRLSNFSYIIYYAPIVAGLIYTASIIKDKESGFFNKLLEIIDLKTYLKVKLAVNTLITFIVFAVSHGTLALYLIIKFGVSNSLAENNGSGALPNAFINIYQISKLTYIIFILLIVSLSAAAFSNLIFAVTTATEKKIFAYVLPIAYTIVTGVFFEIWSVNSVVDFNIFKLFNIVGFSTKGFNVIVYDLILVVLAVGILYLFGYKRRFGMPEIIEA